ncbi:helix-turn-helix protein [compost metagenome]
MIVIKLGKLLEERGITMYQLSKATKVRPNTVSQWVNNEELSKEGKEVKSISIEVLDAFCRELNCTPNDLIEYIPAADR